MEHMNYNGRDDVRVLVVYPDAAEGIARRRAELGLSPVAIEDLKYGREEVGEIVNLLRARLLSGQKATIHGFLDTLRDGWDIIWLVTHGEEAGWYLTDGLVSTSEMTAMIRSAGVFLTVMNTCSSYEAADKAAQELGTAFICTLQEVPDRQAFITGVLFAQNLAAGYDYVTAYELAKPGQSHPYVLIQARTVRAMMPFDRQVPPRGQQPIDTDTIHRIIRATEDLDAIINGNQRLGLPALKDVVKSLQEDLKVIKAQLAQIQERQKMRNFMMWGMGITIVILLAAVGVLIFRLGGVA